MDDILSKDELESLRGGGETSDVFEKLNEAYRTMKEKLNQLNAEKSSDRVNREQLFNQLEQRFVSLREKSEERDTKLRSVGRELEESKNRIREIEKELEEKEARVRAEQSVATSLKSEIDQIRSEKNDAVLSSARRQDAVESLRQDLTESQERCKQLSAQKNEATKSERSARAELQSLEFEIEKLSREKELSKKHQNWLDSELEKQSTELLSSRREASEELLSLRSQLEQSLSREKQMGEKLDTAQARNVESDKRVEELLRNIKSTSDEISSRDAEWKKEMETQRELTRMYQEKCVQSEKENAELNAEIEESKSLIAMMERQSSVKDSARESQIRELRSERNKLSEEKDEIKSTLEKTQSELNDALEKVKHLSEQVKKKNTTTSNESTTASTPSTPRVVSASNLMRSPLGDIPGATSSPTSMTEWYDRVVRAEESFVKERRAREKTEAYLEQVLKEIEEKAPIISQNRRDYERALQQHSVLSRRLTVSLERNESLERRLEESLKTRERAVGESKALKKTIQDLSRQVQVLLWRSHSAVSGDGRSSPPPRSTSNDVFETPSPRSLLKKVDNDKSLDLMDADSMISDHLVTFSTVQQLHVRNQQLLRVVRRLSQKHESFMQTKAAEESEIKTALASRFRKELSEMRAARQRQEAMVAEVVRQRDMYKDLLSKQKHPRQEQQQGPPTQPPQQQPQQEDNSSINNNNTSTTTPMETSSMMMMTQIETQAAITIEREIQRLKTELKESKEELRSYRDDTSKSTAVLQSSLEESRNETSNLRVDLAKSNAQAEFHRKRYEHLVASADSARQDAEREKEERFKITAKLVDFQKLLNEAKNDVKSKSLEIERLHANISNARAEKSVLESSENRLRIQLREMREESAKQGELLETVQQIRQGIESKNSTELEKMREIHEQMTNQISSLRSTLSDQQLETSKVRQEAKAQFTQSTSRLERARKELSDVKAELARSNTQIAALKERLRASEERASAAEQRFDGHLDRLAKAGGESGGDSSAIDRLRLVLEEEMSEKRAAEMERVKELEAQMQEKERHMKQYRDIASAAELTLKKIQTASEQRRVELETKMASLEESRKELLEKIKQKDVAMNETNQELNRAQQAAATVEMKYASQIQALEKQLEESSNRVKQALESEERYKKDAEEHEKARIQAEKNYQRELQLHAEDVKVASEAKSAKQEVEEKCKSLSLKLENVLAEHVETRVSWESQKTSLESQLDDMRSRETEMKSQISLLHSQLETMASDAKRLQEERRTRLTDESVATFESSSTSNSSDEIRDLRSSLQGLHEVVKFLRREKDIADCRADLKEQESLRLGKKVESLSRSLDEARAAEKQALEKAESRSMDATQHEELMKQVEHLNLLQESNAELRSSEKRTSEKLKVTEAKLKETQELVEPMRLARVTLENKLASAKADHAALMKEKNRWQAHAKRLVEKLHAIDPKEHETLKTKCDEMASNVQKLEEKCKELETSLQSSTTRRNKLRELAQKFKKQMNELKKQNAVLKAKGTPGGAGGGVDAAAKKQIATLSTSLNSEKEKNVSLTQKIGVLGKEIKKWKAEHKKISLVVARLKKKKSTTSPEVVTKTISNITTTSKRKREDIGEDDNNNGAEDSGDVEDMSNKKKAKLSPPPSSSLSSSSDGVDLLAKAKEDKMKAALLEKNRRASMLLAKKKKALEEAAKKRQQEEEEVKKRQEEEEQARQKQLQVEKTRIEEEARQKELLALKQLQEAEEEEAHQKALQLEEEAEETRRLQQEMKEHDEMEQDEAQDDEKEKSEKTEQEKMEQEERMEQERDAREEEDKKKQEEEQKKKQEEEEKEEEERRRKVEEEKKRQAEKEEEEKKRQAEKEEEKKKQARLEKEEKMKKDLLEKKRQNKLRREKLMKKLKAEREAAAKKSPAKEDGVGGEEMKKSRTLSKENVLKSKLLLRRQQLAKKKKELAAASNMKQTTTTTTRKFKWQFSLNNNWRDFYPDDSKTLEDEYQLASQDPNKLHVIKLSNKNGNFEITLFPESERGQKRENSKQPKKKIRRVPAGEDDTVTAVATTTTTTTTTTSSTLSSKAKPFVPKSLKRARPADLSDNNNEDVDETKDNDDSVASKKRKIDLDMQLAADQQSFYAQSNEKSPPSPSRSMSVVSTGSEQEKMLLRAARFNSKPAEVDASESTKEEDEEFEALLNDEETDI